MSDLRRSMKVRLALMHDANILMLQHTKLRKSQFSVGNADRHELTDSWNRLWLRSLYCHTRQRCHILSSID
eukprot:6202660-Pleurochrysis_carterae.AAC.4